MAHLRDLIVNGNSRTFGTAYATKFEGPLDGNATSATKATQDGNGNVITSTYATASSLSSHTGNKSNPHGVTKAQVGLGSVVNIDQSKAIKSITRSGTTFTATALDGSTITFTQQDSNTTYGIATSTTPGLIKSGGDVTVDASTGTISINDNSHGHSISNISGLQSALDSKLNTSLKGSKNGLATLDSNGFVPSSQLPSYVDDVIDVSMKSDLTSATNASGATITPETGKIYIDDIGDNASNKTYRWSGTTYVVISETLALGETTSTAFDGARGKVAYNHSQSAHARVDATKTEKSTTNGNIKINGTETNVYTHPSYTAHTSGLYKIANDASGHVSSVTAVTKADITGLGIPGQDTTYPDATTSAHGLMTAAMVSKLNGIATGANAYTHPGYTAHSAGFYKIANDSTGHVSGATAVTKADITALGIPGQDTTYSDMKGATTDGAGNHGLVPAPDKGTSNRYLRSDGTWVVPPDTTYNDATTSAHGLMTAAMVSKLNGIASGANAYTHPSYTAYTSGLYKITVDALGHVSGATAVTKADITALGIPGQDTNTTYSVATSTTPGLVKSGGNVSVNTDGTMSVTYASSAGSANSVSWNNVSGKPTTYTPSAHTHSLLETEGDNRTVNTTPNDYRDALIFKGIKNSNIIGLSSSNTTYSYVIGLRGWNDSTGGASHEFAFNDNGIYHRSGATTSWNAWETIYTSINKPSKSDVGLGNVDNTADANKSVKYATTAGSANAVAWNNVSGKPSTYYTHPSYTSHTAGLYKVTVDGSGHVSDATAVTKADITALGIPGQDTNTTYNDATTSAHGLMTAAMVSKLNGIASGANAYVHPSYTAHGTGLYKVSVDAQGHVSSATAVTKADITALGIPGQDTNTTYGAAGSSLGLIKSGGDLTISNGVAEVINDSHVHHSVVSYGPHDEVASGTTANAPTAGMRSSDFSMYMTQSYNDANKATPANFGNIINVVGTGTGQLFMEWSGADNTLGRLYYRSHRDTSTGGWSGWGAVAYLDDVNKGRIGLSNVQNYDQSKAIKSITRSGTTFTATALDGSTITFTQQDSNTTYGKASSSSDGLMSAADKAKLDGVASGANKYTHPGYTAHASGLYKVTVDSQGHVSGATAVTKADITALGIPGQDTNTTYNDATTSAHGLMTAAMVSKLNGIASGANAYVHPSYTAHGTGLYKVAVDGSGHVSGVTAVTKSDITALGIPGQDTNTTYTLAGLGGVAKSGDTMNGALNFANNVKNKVGDDVAIGDYNQAGSLGIQGLNGTTTVSLIAQGGTWDAAASHMDIVYNTTDQCCDFKFK